eukprot:4329515-Prymnesium_polylepis.1
MCERSNASPVRVSRSSNISNARMTMNRFRVIELVSSIAGCQLEKVGVQAKSCYSFQHGRYAQESRFRARQW